ncbi:MAG TPA: acyltransferase [Polyangiaceae bacterium]|nr:acyltransferase [Polyangiaceae bacterium]
MKNRAAHPLPVRGGPKWACRLLIEVLSPFPTLKFSPSTEEFTVHHEPPSTGPSTTSVSSTQRIEGLDTIRFVLAMCVVFGHCGFLPFHLPFERIPHIGFAVRSFQHNIVNAPAAVIAFFVISGFCVHYPQRGLDRVDLLPFYARRHIRILIPAGFAAIISNGEGVGLRHLADSILWSLLCEEIYYTVYPLLLRLRARTGMLSLLVVSYVASYAVVFLCTNPNGNYQAYGTVLNAVLGYPCWLLGVWLAERIDLDFATNPANRRAPWGWRAGAFVLGVILSILRFHTPVSYPWTLNLFALYVFGWLRAEILSTKIRGSIRMLEAGGAFSYSIYLVHMYANTVWKKNPYASAWTKSSPFLAWFPQIAFIVFVAYVSYRLVEKPSHAMARQFQRWIVLRTARPRPLAGAAPNSTR